MKDMSVNQSERKSDARASHKATAQNRDGGFFALIENISDVVIATDIDGKVRYASPSIERLLGLMPHEVINRCVFEFVHAADEWPAREAFARVLNNPGVSGPLTTVRARRTDGTWRDVEAIGKRLIDGEVVVMNLRDITDRRKAEEALRESEQKLRLYLQQTKLGVIEWDANLRITGWNAAAEKIFGFPAAEVLGKEAGFLVPAEFQDFAAEVGVWLMGDAHTGPHTNENVTRDGYTIFCDWSNTPLTGADGKFIGVISLVEDVTEQRRLQEHVAHTQRMEMIGTMASGIAHDLNNILAPIVMMGPALRHEISTETGLAKLDALESCAQRGIELVNHVLALTRGSKVERMNVQTRKVITEIAHIVEEVFPKTIRLKTVLPEDLWLVHANATELHQVLMNLCINARDAMPRGGTLTIKARNAILTKLQAAVIPNAVAGPYVEWQISDTGLGIPAEILGKIFDPFFSTKERNKGTGLGLSVALRIIRSHGGFIQVESEVARGTEFKIYFPVAAQANKRNGP